MDVLYVGLVVLFFGLTWRSSSFVSGCRGRRCHCLYVVGGLVSIGLFVYLVLALLKRRSSSHDSERDRAARFLHRRSALAGEAAGSLHGPGLREPPVPASTRRSDGSSA